MLQPLLHRLWSLRREFAKYFMVGVSGVVLDIGTLVIFTKVFNVPPFVGVILNQSITLTYNFILNKYWSFRNRDLPGQQIARYLSLMGMNYLFAVGVMYLGNERLGIHYLIVRLGTIAIMMGWNFFLYKYWVYKKLPGHSPSA